MMRRHAETAEKDIAEGQYRFGCCLFDAELVSEDDGKLTYRIKDENGSEYTYEEDSNSVKLQSDGDVADGEVEVEVSGDASGLPAADAAD